jgi:hypothetical protein
MAGSTKATQVHRIEVVSNQLSTANFTVTRLHQPADHETSAAGMTPDNPIPRETAKPVVVSEADQAVGHSG